MKPLTISECAAALRAREVSAVELCDEAATSIEQTDGALHAYLARTFDHARARARAADEQLRLDGAGTSPLCGVPMAIKDVLCTKGVETTAASRILQGFVPPYTATAVERLHERGAVMMGKTNCDEFAMGSSNENSAFGPAHNPWALDRIPGGSSGGSAATVAARNVAFSIGTDTGGSIRQPASLCGVVGFKPTYGRISRYGLIAFASSLDQIGPFALTVEDCALVYQAIAGHDARDSTSSPTLVSDPVKDLHAGVRGMRLGIPREYFGQGIDSTVKDCVNAAVRTLEELGAHIEEVSLPSTEAALSTYYVIAPAEASSNLARYDGVRFGPRAGGSSLMANYLKTRGQGFGVEVKRRIMLGTYVLSSGYYDAYYRQAQKVRTMIAGEFGAVFERVDALVCPTSPVVAFPIGKLSDPLAFYALDVLTLPVNLAGLPGISVPCGFVDDLPVGLQIIGPRFADDRVLRIAHAYEQATLWHTRMPALVATA